MRPLRYSINVTLDGCCDHRAEYSRTKTCIVVQIADRELDPVEREIYENGVRKIVYRDPDGNEFAFGSAPK